MKTLASFLCMGFVALALGLIAWPADARNGNSQKGPSNFFIKAHLVDKTKNADKNAATVEVTVQGIRLVDPSFLSEDSGRIVGHLHYQLDGGPVIATEARKLSFHDLSWGKHTILVNLVDDKHVPIGMPILLTVPAARMVMSY